MSSTPPPTLSRRERKKAATRQAIADAALALFLENGYEQVGVKQIAEAADVALTTLFKHFPSKEALVFDEDAEQEEALIAAVRERPAGETILSALRRYIRTFASDELSPELKRFLELVDGTPALRDYADRMWIRHQGALAAAITSELDRPADDPASAALALFALDALRLAHGRDDLADRVAAIDAAFDLIEHGFDTGSPSERATPSVPHAVDES